MQRLDPGSSSLGLLVRTGVTRWQRLPAGACAALSGVSRFLVSLGLLGGGPTGGAMLRLRVRGGEGTANECCCGRTGRSAGSCPAGSRCSAGHVPRCDCAVTRGASAGEHSVAGVCGCCLPDRFCFLAGRPFGFCPFYAPYAPSAWGPSSQVHSKLDSAWARLSVLQARRLEGEHVAWPLRAWRQLEQDPVPQSVSVLCDACRR